VFPKVEIAINIIRQPGLRKMLIDEYKAVSVMDSKDNDFHNRHYVAHVNLNYLFHKEVVNIFLHTPDFEDLIQHYAQLCMIDKMKNRTSHILYDSDGYDIHRLKWRFKVIRFGYFLVKEINYFDLPFNQNIFNQFITQINSLLLKWSDAYQNKEGFVEAPLLSLFSLYIVRYLFTNLSVKEN
jgi:hypothetical protein